MKFKGKILSLILLFMILFSNLCFAKEPNVASKAALLVEASTGKILYEKNAYDKMYPASTTKVLTAILVLENCDLSEMATVSHNAIYSLPSGYVNANLHKGEQISVESLMYALMVKSANDAAIVLAEHVAGSVEKFSDMMNEKAKEIGCKNTHFVNPNGIHNDNHYTTAYDLYLMAAYGMKNETFRKFVSTPTYTLLATNMHPMADRICITTNDLLRTKSKYYNENVIGIKTGHTTEAQNCLIAGAKKNDIELISVVLYAGTNSAGLSERYLDTNNLLDYGFDDFAFSNIIEKNAILNNIVIENGNKDTKNLDLIAKETVTSYINKNIDLTALSPEIKLQENIEAPIESGTVLGTATYTIDNIEYTTELLASHDVKEKINIGQIFALICGILLLFVGIMLLKKTKKYGKKKRRK